MSAVADSGSLVAPFSPMLFAGLLLKPLPVAALQPVFSGLIRNVCQRYPGIHQALVPFAGARVEIDPVDMPFILSLDIAADTLRLRVIGRSAARREPADAAIHAALTTLMSMVEGRIDGDAVFFSRQLSIEGDTELVLALRNAIDGADIMLARSLSEPFGALAAPLERMLHSAGTAYGRLARSVEGFRQSLIAPAMHGIDLQNARNEELEAQLNALQRKVRRSGTVRAARAPQ